MSGAYTFTFVGLDDDGSVVARDALDLAVSLPLSHGVRERLRDHARTLLDLEARFIDAVQVRIYRERNGVTGIVASVERETGGHAPPPAAA